MRLERVTKDNIETAIQIQEELFPGESGRENFEDSLKEASGFEYYLIYEDNVCAGIIGIYSYPVDPESAWLGWFGIREGYRRKHLGTKALRRFEQHAASHGYRFARLYTDADNNEEAIRFYEVNGYRSEPYENEEDEACRVCRTLIFSKSLGDEPLVPWNSRNIHLTQQIEKQEKYSRDTAGSE